MPDGWAACNGQLLNTNEYSALFALIGTTYGGDGITSFGVPDLRGRVPLSQGQGNGLSNYVLGQAVGFEQVVLNGGNLHMHSHAIQVASASPAQGPKGVPSPAVRFATASGLTPYISAPSSAPAVMAQTSITVTGGNSTNDNMMPTLVMNYCIALEGIYPT